MAIRLTIALIFALAVVTLVACSESPTPTAEPTLQDASANTPRIAFHSNRDGNWNIYLMNPGRHRPNPPDRRPGRGLVAELVARRTAHRIHFIPRRP